MTTPINLNGYLAALAGATAGMGVAGWITDSNPSTYTLTISIATAFAQAFDQAWNNSTILDILEQQAITAVVTQEFIDRAPGPLSNPVYQEVSNWAEAAGACVALIQKMDSATRLAGIIPPSVPNTNYVVSTNAAAVTGANPMIFSAAPITKQGSGVFRVTATSCPIPSGEPVEITFTIFRDSIQLPPIQKSSPVGPGDDSPCHQEWIDVITDSNPHTYSLHASAVTGTLSDPINHCTITVSEI
jgi:hypothetical protein